MKFFLGQKTSQVNQKSLSEKFSYKNLTASYKISLQECY